MNPAANAATSSGVAGAVVVILCWALAMVHVAVPPEVAAAFGSLMTAGGGYFLHTRTRPALAPPAQPASDPPVKAG